MQNRMTFSGFLAVLILIMITPVVFAAEKPSVMFDQGHGQRFVIDKEGPLHLSGLAQVFRDAGWQVAAAGGQISDNLLSQTDLLVISGAFGSYAPAEIERIVRFVENGGRLAVMLHIGPPLADLLHRLEVDFTNRPISEQKNIINSDPRTFSVRNLSPHPLTAGVEQFSVYGCWALMNTDDNSGIIAASSDKSWIDMDGSGKPSDRDAVQSFGVLVTGSHGKGRFAVFGDDAMFQNRFLDEANRKLAGNLAGWLR